MDIVSSNKAAKISTRGKGLLQNNLLFPNDLARPWDKSCYLISFVVYVSCDDSLMK